ncbi:MAG: YcxB family protein [Huintestinicola sp.]
MDNQQNFIEHYLNTEEPVLFEAAVTKDIKMYQDFDNFNYRKRQTAAFVINLVAMIFSIIIGLLCIILGKALTGVFLIALGVVCFVFPKLQLNKSSAEESSSIVNSGSPECYKFYQNYFIDSDRFSICAVPYEIITDAYETDEYFYMFVSKRRAYIIPKNSFTFNTPQEMRKMLSIKLGGRFINHCKA